MSKRLRGGSNSENNVRNRVDYSEEPFSTNGGNNYENSVVNNNHPQEIELFVKTAVVDVEWGSMNRPEDREQPELSHVTLMTKDDLALKWAASEELLVKLELESDKKASSKLYLKGMTGRVLTTHKDIYGERLLRQLKLQHEKHQLRGFFHVLSPLLEKATSDWNIEGGFIVVMNVTLLYLEYERNYIRNPNKSPEDPAYPSKNLKDVFLAKLYKKYGFSATDTLKLYTPDETTHRRTNTLTLEELKGLPEYLNLTSKVLMLLLGKEAHDIQGANGTKGLNAVLDKHGDAFYISVACGRMTRLLVSITRVSKKWVTRMLASFDKVSNGESKKKESAKKRSGAFTDFLILVSKFETNPEFSIEEAFDLLEYFGIDMDIKQRLTHFHVYVKVKGSYCISDDTFEDYISNIIFESFSHVTQVLKTPLTREQDRKYKEFIEKVSNKGFGNINHKTLFLNAMGTSIVAKRKSNPYSLNAALHTLNADDSHDFDKSFTDAVKNEFVRIRKLYKVPERQTGIYNRPDCFRLVLLADGKILMYRVRETSFFSRGPLLTLEHLGVDKSNSEVSAGVLEPSNGCCAGHGTEGNKLHFKEYVVLVPGNVIFDVLTKTWVSRAKSLTVEITKFDKQSQGRELLEELGIKTDKQLRVAHTFLLAESLNEHFKNNSSFILLKKILAELKPASSITVTKLVKKIIDHARSNPDNNLLSPHNRSKLYRLPHVIDHLKHLTSDVNNETKIGDIAKIISNKQPKFNSEANAFMKAEKNEQVQQAKRHKKNTSQNEEELIHHITQEAIDAAAKEEESSIPTISVDLFQEIDIEELSKQEYLLEAVIHNIVTGGTPDMSNTVAWAKSLVDETSLNLPRPPSVESITMPPPASNKSTSNNKNRPLPPENLTNDVLPNLYLPGDVLHNPNPGLPKPVLPNPYIPYIHPEYGHPFHDEDGVYYMVRDRKTYLNSKGGINWNRTTSMEEVD